MKRTNGQEGITLIALVVTIVVLLILAGVTITYVMSDGGIFNTATKAVEETKVGVILDYVGNAQSQIMVANYDPSVVASDKTGNTAAALAIFTTHFPANYKFDATEGTGSTVTYANGKFTGELKVGISTTTYADASETYTVTFENGVATCTKDAKSE